MQTPSTRLATPADLDAVAALFDQYRQFYEQAPDLQAARTFIAARMANAESVIWLGHDAQGQVGGFCQLYPSFCSVAAAPILVLYDLFVAPTARRSGLARALISAAQNYATAQGVARMDLTTAHSNGQAQALYLSMGWQPDTVFRAFNWTPQPANSTA